MLAIGEPLYWAINESGMLSAILLFLCRIHDSLLVLRNMKKVISGGDKWSDKHNESDEERNKK